MHVFLVCEKLQKYNRDVQDYERATCHRLNRQIEANYL